MATNILAEIGNLLILSVLERAQNETAADSATLAESEPTAATITGNQEGNRPGYDNSTLPVQRQNEVGYYVKKAAQLGIE